MINIRKASQDDTKALLGLILDLAKYQDQLHHLKRI